MCDAVITPDVPRADKLVANAKVFIEGKNRPLLVTDDFTNLSLALNRPDTRVLRVTNLNGEETTLPRERVVSVVKNEHLPQRVDTSGVAFDGFRYTFRACTDADAATLGIAPIRNGVLVTAEDLAEAEVLAYNIGTGEVVWQNPAEPLRAIKRVIKAIRLLVEAKALFDQSMQLVEQNTREVADAIQASDDVQAAGEAAHGVVPAGAGLTEDQTNAVATLQAGLPVEQAIAAAGREFVLAFVSESAFSGTVNAVLVDGYNGEITGYDQESELFELMNLSKVPLEAFQTVQFIEQ